MIPRANFILKDVESLFNVPTWKLGTYDKLGCENEIFISQKIYILFVLGRQNEQNCSVLLHLILD